MLSASKYLSISNRVLALGAACVIVAALAAVVAAFSLHDALEQSRRRDMKHAVEFAATLAQGFADAHKRGELSLEEARARAASALRPVRFDDGNYVFAYDLDGVSRLQPARPDFEGKSRLDAKDASGHAYIKAFIATAKKGGGFVDYMWLKPGDTEPSVKASYILPVPSLGWLVGAGVHLDDIAREAGAIVLRLVLAVAPLCLALLVLALGFGRALRRGLRELTAGLARITAGDLTATIAGGERRDEMGAIARSVTDLQVSLRMAEAERTDRDRETRARIERQQALEAAVTDFDAKAHAIVGSVSKAAQALRQTASTLTSNAGEADRQAGGAAIASDSAARNVDGVAAAAEELAGSVREIGRQMGEQQSVASRAVSQADATGARVRELATAAQTIGAIVELISGIAGQTNLLALNATIEAARAGEAGRGFAVVASEVKSLAEQTAKATQEIAGQIAAIQSTTAASVDAIGGITTVISDINAIATAMSAAVEQQGQATAEIARHADDASRSSRDVRQMMDVVTASATASAGASTHVLASAADLSEQAERLQAEIDDFLAKVRAA